MEPLFVAKTDDLGVLWWLAGGFLVLVAAATGAAVVGLHKTVALAVLLVLTVPVLAATLWVALSHTPRSGQLRVSAEAIVLVRPFARTLRLNRPVTSVQYIEWKDDHALGIGILGNVGMTAVLCGVGDKIRIGGKGIHSVPGIAPIGRQFHTAPSAAVRKGDFHRVLDILREDGAHSPQQRT